MKKLLILASIILLVTVVLVYAQADKSKAPAKAVAAPKTIENLQAAYNGETNARAKYTVFAKKADEEGFAGVASLFRAAAYAESVHAEAHALVIRKLGVDPKKEIKPADVKSTKENLEVAIKGESYERDTMYPDFIKQAKVDGIPDAERTFTLAKTAEAEHANLYGEALRSLDKWKEKKDFFVCSICGYTVTKIDFDACPSCEQPKDKYRKVS